jgi:hypothetical protein
MYVNLYFLVDATFRSINKYKKWLSVYVNMDTAINKKFVLSMCLSDDNFNRSTFKMKTIEL